MHARVAQKLPLLDLLLRILLGTLRVHRRAHAAQQLLVLRREHGERPPHRLRRPPRQVHRLAGRQPAGRRLRGMRPLAEGVRVELELDPHLRATAAAPGEERGRSCAAEWGEG
eukprot:2619787-Prymnesium_polylepis.1